MLFEKSTPKTPQKLLKRDNFQIIHLYTGRGGYQPPAFCCTILDTISCFTVDRGDVDRGTRGWWSSVETERRIVRCTELDAISGFAVGVDALGDPSNRRGISFVKRAIPDQRSAESPLRPNWWF